jgi:zinc transporter
VTPTAPRTRSWPATPRCRDSRLGKARRRAAQLWRQFALRPRVIDRLRARLPSWIDEHDRFDLLNALDRMETLVDELQAIEQREAGLEAEVAARLSEETNRNLYICPW